MTKADITEQRRQMGLCFKCGEKYSPGRRCNRQLLLLEGRNEEVTEEMEATGEGKGGGISLHALIGCPSNKIIKVEGLVSDKKLRILIDTGSTQFPQGL